MKTDLHVHFAGDCAEAFAMYEKTFDSKITMTLKYGQAPGGMPVPEGMADKVMHTSMTVGTINLMGCDAPDCDKKGRGGFEISLTVTDSAEAKRLFDALSAGGDVTMPLTPTFWSPLFGMCTDKFGVGWMVSLPSPQDTGHE